MVRVHVELVFLAAVCFVARPVEAQDTHIALKTDVVFSVGPDYQLKLDIAYPTEGTLPRPAIVYVHGNWEQGNRSEFDAAIQSAATKGYVAITVDHRPIHQKVQGKPRFPYPAQVCDIWAAVGWLRTNARTYNVDSTRIGAVGYSSGAYLVLVAALASPIDPLYAQCSTTGISAPFRAVVSLSGITDVVDKYNASFPQMMVDLLGGSPEQFPELYREASPVNLVSPLSPPILTIHGDKDPYVPLREAMSLDSKMKALGKSHILIIEPNGRHGNSWFRAEVWNFLKVNLQG